VRTQEQVDRIKSEEHYSVFAFSNVVPWLNPQAVDRLPLATALLARVMATAKPIVVAAKDDWKRPRPFLINSRVFPSLEKPKDSAYPSGHSTRATLDALVLAQLSPGNAAAISRRGMQVGDDRVIAGVHYPSDVLAGRKLAQAIFDRMMQEKDFRDELKAAQAEVKAFEQKGG
jgi:acid phosphatase (class A)